MEVIKNRSSSILAQEFINSSEKFFQAYPQVEHSWSVITGAELEVLEIPSRSEIGFEITCVIEDAQIVISSGGHHDHYEVEGDEEDFVNHLFGLIYDLLTPVMRLKEYRAGKSGYKWELELLENGGWKTESCSGLLFYNYFARKSVKIYQNKQLPVR